MDKRRKNRIGFDTSRTSKNKSEKNSYRNEEFGFEIDIPNDWSPYNYSLPFIPSLLFAIVHGWAPQVDAAFACGYKEILNIVVESMMPEPSPEFTKSFFLQYARNMNLTDVRFGRITVLQKEP